MTGADGDTNRQIPKKDVSIEENPVNIQLESCSQSSFFEAQVVDDIVREAAQNPATVGLLFGNFSAIIKRYQEMPELLDPHMDSIISPLTICLLQQARSADIEAANLSIRNISQMLHCLASVRGHKHVAKYFPVDVEAFDPVLCILKRLLAAKSCEGNWEGQCQFMLWLSALTQVPFDLSLFDPSGTKGSSGIVKEILAICESVMQEAGAVRDYGCILLSKLLSRPDLAVELENFLATSKASLSEMGSWSEVHVFKSIGIVKSVGWAFKHCQRESVVRPAKDMWPVVLPLIKSDPAGKNPLLRRLLVKLYQRIGISLLAPRVLTWKYVKKTVQLGSQLDASEATKMIPNPVVAEENEADWDIPEELEEILGVLLEAVRDNDTEVRWSSAKGIGRICSRLPKDLVEDVLGSVVEIISPLEAESGWHGACLTIAELSKRGLLLPASIPTVVPLVESALQYDVRKGSYSIGTNVRDSAAYVCWACARSYEPEVLAPYIGSLARVLMVVACTDREVNCRRAASAAFQECVGRISNVPDGIDILSRADYFALSTMSQAFLEVVPAVAAFSYYRPLIIHHLLHEKLRHWDIAVRGMTASALEKLVPAQPDFFSHEAITLLLDWCLNATLDVRHGAGLGLASVLRGLAKNNIPIESDLQKRIGNIVVDIEKARLFRGKGGEIMRAAVCTIITSIAESGLSGPDRRQKRLMVSVLENIKHPKEEIQSVAVQALHSLSRQCDTDDMQYWVDHTTEVFLKDLDSENVAVRRGYASGLGALPCSFLKAKSKKNKIEAVLKGLSKATMVEADPEEQDAESRVRAVKALTSVLLELGSSLSWNRYTDLVQEHLEVYFSAMEDYCTDYRGDVGSWVRCAAMDGIRALALAACSHKDYNTKPDLTNSLARIAEYLLRNSVERINNVREQAAGNLRLLLENQSITVPHRKELEVVFSSDVDISKFSTLSGVGLVAPFLQYVPYQMGLMEGLVASIGGLDKSLSDAATAVFLGHVDSLCNSPALGNPTDFMDVLLQVGNKHNHSARMSTPVLKTLHEVLKNSSIMEHLSDEKLNDVLAMAKAEVKQCRDISRLLAAAKVGCTLALISSPAMDFQKAVQPPAWRLLASLLGNRFPRVRRGTAEIVYESLLFLEEHQKILFIMGLLLDTAWDSSIEQSVTARDSICKQLGLEPIVRRKLLERKRQHEGLGEDNSYQAFIGDFARGF